MHTNEPKCSTVVYSRTHLGAHNPLPSPDAQSTSIHFHLSPLPPLLSSYSNVLVLTPPLQFYGLFKQAENGDNTTTRPGMMDFVGKAKWDAWTKHKGLSQDEAKDKYVQHFVTVLDKEGGEESQKLKAEVSGGEDTSQALTQ